MNANAVKPTVPYVTRRKISSTPLSEQKIERTQFIDSHNFSFSIDKETGMLKTRVESK